MPTRICSRRSLVYNSVQVEGPSQETAFKELSSLLESKYYRSIIFFSDLKILIERKQLLYRIIHNY